MVAGRGDLVEPSAGEVEHIARLERDFRTARAQKPREPAAGGRGRPRAGRAAGEGPNPAEVGRGGSLGGRALRLAAFAPPHSRHLRLTPLQPASRATERRLRGSSSTASCTQRRALCIAPPLLFHRLLLLLNRGLRDHELPLRTSLRSPRLQTLRLRGLLRPESIRAGQLPGVVDPPVRVHAREPPDRVHAPCVRRREEAEPLGAAQQHVQVVVVVVVQPRRRPRRRRAPEPQVD
mmetsp:Transcript_4460/g.11108  ORF Transcript_4460/g.11108 Transcript_4460/m.11108 type:complete len:235 (+) Transcript_4460:342-1046(+)